MQQFARQEQERIRREFSKRLEALPKRDGAPDFDAIENPEELAQAWAAEIIGDDLERLDRVQRYFADKQPER